MGYRVTHGFSAPAEVVFGTATDLDRWARWLPPHIQLARVADDELRVDWSGRVSTVHWRVQPEELRVAAHSTDPGWSGSLTIVALPAGGSTAQLEIDGEAGPTREVAQRALAYLAAEVADNFTAG